MNRASLKRKLIVSLSLLIVPKLSVADAPTEIRASPDFPEELRARAERAVDELGSELRSLGINKRAWPASIRLSLLDPSKSPGVWARAVGDAIEVHPRVPTAHVSSVLRHEFVHAVFEKKCPTLAKMSPLVAETFALWVSRDYIRLAASAQKFAFAKEARSWIDERTRIASPLRPILKAPLDSKTRREAEDAISRLLIATSNDGDWTERFRKVLGNCRKVPLEAHEAEILKGFQSESRSPSARPADFLAIDAGSLEILAAEGRIDVAFPTASVMKPLLVHSIPALVRSRVSQNAPEWRCPDQNAALLSRPWSWAEALAKSCNGFFLSAALEPDVTLSPAIEFARRFGIIVGNSMPQAIGLVPGSQASLRSIALAYRHLDLTAPAITEALLETAKTGTIAAEPAAAWFRENAIAVKTGTIRNSESRPIHGWIVAIARSTVNGAWPVIAVIHGEGRSPSQLLEELKTRLSLHLSRLMARARVQILGLVPEARISIGCAANTKGLIKKDKAGSWSFSKQSLIQAADLREGEAVACASGALRVSHPQGRRDYFGVLEILPPQPGPAENVSGTAKQKRARRGSSLVLLTSERHYVASVLASEFPNGNLETLKALAFVVRNNLHFERHPGRPPCDTTHCQVFGHQNDLPGVIATRIHQAVESLDRIDGPRSSAASQWMPFHLGGRRPWSRTLSAERIRDALEWQPALHRIEFNGDRARLLGEGNVATTSSRTLGCEDLRNRLQLPSCPSTARRVSNDQWIFEGRGEGHGLGLPLIEADVLARQGVTASALLDRYFSSKHQEGKSIE